MFSWASKLSVLLLSCSLVAGTGSAYAAEAPQKIPVSPTPVVSKNVPLSSLPAKIALQNESTIWLWDASQKGSIPKEIVKDGTVQLLDWSADGKWLAYLRSPHKNSYSWDLWVISADGKQKFQVETLPVYETAKWSPTESMLAYSTVKASTTVDNNTLRPTRQEGRVVQVTPSGVQKISTFYEEVDFTDVSDFSWAPDGKSLAVSYPRINQQKLHIDQVFLNGTSKTLYTLQKSNNTFFNEDYYIYPRSAIGLVWSPNAEYMAFFLKPNSGSLSADGVPLQVLQVNTKRIYDIGGGLVYPEWLSWSKDSSRLAFIEGGDRMTAYGKHLAIWEALTKQVYDQGKTGMVDTLPQFAPDSSSQLFFLRGKETEWNYSENKPLVPDQRIWQEDVSSGSEKQLTAGSKVTSDTLYSLSPSHEQMTFVRLTTPTEGSLYMKNLVTGKEVEILRGLTLSPGFYGNYVPSFVRVQW
ncbi:copper amine oxidase [Brevibacillus daliensis]|uniref:copper amine oxidase n=1 Tax=Brevibacillus daliensis TaxID=2892995 RepID=UPI001E58B067|nr:copper amine oxidase [Brevibacillus daliensis]